jgi:hypothetical protein
VPRHASLIADQHRHAPVDRQNEIAGSSPTAPSWRGQENDPAQHRKRYDEDHDRFNHAANATTIVGAAGSTSFATPA